MPNKPLPTLKPKEWLSERLALLAEHDPRFEASWYGLYSALLSHYFPYEQQFITKPQMRLRKEWVEDDDFSFSSLQAESSAVFDEPGSIPDASMTSTGGLALQGCSAFIPDFVVVKATRFTTHDMPLLLVEIKTREPENSALGAYEYQVEQYMEALMEGAPGCKNLVGLLICGTSVSIFRLDGLQSAVRVDKARYNVDSEVVRSLLLEIAVANWEYQG